MPTLEDDGFVYPTPSDVIRIHESVLEEDPDAETGVLKEGHVEFTIEFIRDGYFGECPETIHEKASHLLRLISAGHAFVDGNKRTALNSTATFYMLNGCYFEYGDEIKDLVKRYADDESAVEIEQTIAYLTERAVKTEAIPDDWLREEIERILGVSL